MQSVHRALTDRSKLKNTNRINTKALDLLQVPGLLFALLLHVTIRSIPVSSSNG